MLVDVLLCDFGFCVVVVIGDWLMIVLVLMNMCVCVGVIVVYVVD